MPALATLTQNIKQHFDALSKIGNLGPKLEDGFLRAAWSNEETEAMNYVANYAEKHNLVCEYDAIGNLFVRTEKHPSKKIFQFGSHLDTVPGGGTFDGAAGVIAALEAIIAVKKSAKELNLVLELVAWRGEESATFKALYMGSLSAFGRANPKHLTHSFQGKTLEEAIRSQGYDPEFIQQGQATMDQGHIDRIVGHLELHIEQANKLEQDNCDVGIVTGIRGAKRFRAAIKGEHAHSGATPMGLPYRKDANLTTSYIAVRINEELNQKLEKGYDLVQTMGVINSDKTFNQSYPEIYSNGMTKVAGLAYFLLDIRSTESSTLEQHSEDCIKIMQSTAKEFGTIVNIETLSSTKPVEQLDQNLHDKLAEACIELNYSYQRLSSGAGHDAAVVAATKQSNGSNIPTEMIFIPCKDGVSHNPSEFAKSKDIAKGTNLIIKLLEKLQNDYARTN